MIRRFHHSVLQCLPILLKGMVVLALLGGMTGCPGDSDDSSSEDVPQPTPIQHSTGSHDACTDDKECPAGEYCDTALDICRTGCLEDSDCAKGTLCDPEQNICVVCADDDDCPYGVCHPDFKTCVKCLSDDDCGGGACIPELFSCVQCTDDSYCDAGVCDEGQFVCKECTSDTHCDDGDGCTRDACVEEVCAHTTKIATIGCGDVECLKAEDCPTPEVGCATCEAFQCDVKINDTACATDIDCVLADSPCLTPTCKETACGGSLCGYTLEPDCTACAIDSDCPLGETSCSATCSNGTCEYTELGSQGCECTVDSQCTTNNPCDIGTCENNACAFTTLVDLTSCEDGDPCTVGEICLDGVCGSGQAKAECGLPCESTSDCAKNTFGCSGECIDSQCLYPPLAGACPACATVADCDDGNPCTNDTCQAGICLSKAPDEAIACDDNDPCTIDTICSSGACVGTVLPNCPGECVTTEDCPTPTTPVCAISCEDFACSYQAFPPECPEECPSPSPCHEIACAEGFGPCSNSCQEVPIEGCIPCTKDTDCVTDNGCAKTHCDKKEKSCVQVLLTGTPCGDEDLCKDPSTCIEGTCEEISTGITPEKVCEDNNPCTKDSCDPATGCIHTATTGEACDDQDLCTKDDACFEGVCKGGSPSEECTSEKACMPALSTCDTKDDCPDNSSCLCAGDTVAPVSSGLSGPDLTCAAKVCVPDGITGIPTNEAFVDLTVCQALTQQDCLEDPACACVPSCKECDDCAVILCSAADVGCSACASKADCNGDACTTCSFGICTSKETPSCEDSCPQSTDSCVNVTCEISECTAICDEENIPDCEAPCESNADCPLSSECTGYSCVDGECLETYAAEETECLGDSPCADTPTGFCSQGQCEDALPCDDQDSCTKDICTDDGCTHEIVWGKECDDGDACTGPDACGETGCYGAPILCETLSDCLESSCEPESGCTTTPLPLGTECKDNNVCTLGAQCNDGECQSLTPVECEDGNPCTLDSCSPEAGGCVFDPVADSACDDGLPCTAQDTCLANGECVGSVVAAQGLLCDDNDACTTDDSCVEGTCTGGSPTDCPGTGSGPCQTGACSPDFGCYLVQSLDDTPCNDGDACSTSSSCNSGFCIGTEFLTCNDGNPCTTDACSDEAQGCTATPLQAGTPCEDGLLCTENDSCQSGTCISGSTVVCEEDTECLQGICNPEDGECVKTPVLNGVFCDDGQLCTEQTTCQDGVCGGGIPLACQVPDECFTASCDPDTGECVISPSADGTSCTLAGGCSTAGTCKAGLCEHPALTNCAPDKSGVEKPCFTGLQCATTACGKLCVPKDGPTCCLKNGVLSVENTGLACVGALAEPVDSAMCSDTDVCCIPPTGEHYLSDLLGCYIAGGASSPDLALCAQASDDSTD